MKRMVKAAIIIAIITVLLLAILNSCARLRSYEYKPVVSYESNNSSNITEIAEITEVNDSSKYRELGAFGSILRYEQVLLISSIVLVVIFTFIFFNITPKKK